MGSEGGAGEGGSGGAGSVKAQGASKIAPLSKMSHSQTTAPAGPLTHIIDTAHLFDGGGRRRWGCGGPRISDGCGIGVQVTGVKISLTPHMYLWEQFLVASWVRDDSNDAQGPY